MNKEFYKNRFGIFPIFWGSRRKERDMFFFTSQINAQEKKKNKLYLLCPLYRSFSVHSRQDRTDHGSMKEKKTVWDKKETKNNQIQENRKESSVGPHVIGKAVHDKQIQGGNVKKRGKGNWSQEKKEVSDKKETKNNQIQENRKKSSVDFKVIGLEKAAHDREIKDGSMIKKKESTVNSNVVGVEKATHKRRINVENVTKRGEGHWSRKKKSAYPELSQAQKLEESKNDFTYERKKPGHQSHIKDQKLQRKDKKVDNAPNHQKQIKASILKRNKKIFHDHRNFNKCWKQPQWLNNRTNDKYISVRRRLKEQMKLGVKKVFEKQVAVVQGFFPAINSGVEKKITQVERSFAIQQRLSGQTHIAVAASPSKKSIKSHYIATVNNWLGGKAKLSDKFESKGIKILHKNSPKDIDLQQMMHKSLLKAKPVMHKSQPKGKVLYILGHQKSKQGASHQTSLKGVINQWFSLEVNLSDKIKTKGNKGLHKISPKSKGLHRVAHKNLTKESNLQGRSHQSYFKYLLEGIPQTSFDYRLIEKVNKMSSMAQKIVRKTEKLLQQQNKKIQGLEIKLVKFYNGEEIAKAKDCETKFIEKFRNMLMRDGKKSKARTILLKSLKLFRTYLEGMSIQEEFMQKLAETESNNYTVYCLQEAVKNVKPSLEVRKKKISGIIRQIPAVPSEKRQQSVSIRWIIESARKRKKKSSKPFFQCLAEEFLDAYKKQGEPYKRKQALHNTAEASRIYIRYRWW